MRYTLLMLALSSLAGCNHPPAPVAGHEDAPAFPERVAHTPRPVAGTQSDLLGMQLGAEEIKHQRALTLFNLAIEKAEKALREADWDKAVMHANEAAGVVDEHRDALWGQEITEFREIAARALAAAQARRQVSGDLRSSGREVSRPTASALSSEVAAAEKRRQIRMLHEEARTYAQNRRFIEAIDTLKALLAIDPGNAEARAELRQLEDVTAFRTYDRVKELQARETSGGGAAAKEAIVPYGGTVTYPSDWVETSRRRQ